MIKIGDVLVCVNNQTIGYKSEANSLTIGKKYIALSDNEYVGISVLNDNEEVIFYDPRRFIVLQEWRQQQLDKLC